jgi:Na+/H+ antiporter NhaA
MIFVSITATMGIALMASVVVAMVLAVMEAAASFFKACQMPRT